MLLSFNTYGNEKQKECCRAWLDPNVLDIVYGGSKGSGKSYLGCALIFADALTYPNTFYFIARKKLNDLRKYTIPSIHEVFTDWGVSSEYYKFNGQDNYFLLYNGSRVYLLEAAYQPQDPLYERFGSMQMTRGWIEEAGEFSLEAKNNLQASIGRWNNDTYNLAPKILMTCNPSKNFLFSDYYKKFRDNKLEGYRRFIQAFPQDNKRLPASYLLNLQRTLTFNQKERLLYGNWEFDDDPTLLVDYSAICDMFTNDYVLPEANNILTADLAMKGRDKFIVGSWKGFVCELAYESTYNGGKHIEEKLKEIALERKVARSKIVVDSDGMGNYLEDYMNGIYEFKGNASASDAKKYKNLKSECAHLLAEKINKRELKIICTPEQEEAIKEDFNVLKIMSVNSDESAAQLISKKQMREILGRSPDYLDILIMRFALEVKRKYRGMQKVSYKARK